MFGVVVKPKNPTQDELGILTFTINESTQFKTIMIYFPIDEYYNE